MRLSWHISLYETHPAIRVLSAIRSRSARHLPGRSSARREQLCTVAAIAGLAAQADLFHQPVRGLVSFADPIDDLVRLRRILQLDADCAVDSERLDLLQIGHEVDNAAARGQVAVDFPVAIAQM